MKKIIFGLGLILLGAFVQAQNGLENIIVEKYYISDATDAAGSSGTLPVGSVTYRIYADMLPGYKFQMAYGTSNHNLKFTSTTSFFNNTDFGATTPTYSKGTAKYNTTMLDSWLSVGAACTNNFGILKSEDNGVNNVVNADGLLHNTDPLMGIPLTTQDGLIAGSPQAISFIGMDAGQINAGAADVFGDGSVVGNSFILTGSAWTTLSSGSTGPIPATNRVLIAQITTDGVFHYELNVQIGTPTGGIQCYVSSNPVIFNGQMELTMPSLSGTFDALPTAFAVTGSGSYCQGGAGLPVGLANSELGVTYTLTPGGATLAGTGSAISFGNQLFGTYTISGTSSNGTRAMTGSAVIVENTPVVPTFTQLGPYCQGSTPAVLPTTSTNSITGTWNSSISTATSGTSTYTFTPTAGLCATAATMNILVNAPVTPTFTALGPYFQGNPAGTLPSTSLNSITGVWSPATISTASVGTATYNFTPNGGQCANSASMNIAVNPQVASWSFTQDIGTTLMVSCPTTSGAILYSIQYRLLGSSTWIGNLASSNNFVKVSNLTPGGNYEFRVRSYRPGPVLMSISNIQNYQTTTVSYTKAYDIGSTCQIGWNDYSSFASSYVLQYRKVGSATWLGTNTYINEVKVTGLLPDNDYEYKVTVFKGGSVWGTTQSSTFHTGNVLFSSTNVTTTSLDINWNQTVPDGAPWVTSYAFHYKLPTSSTWMQYPSTTNSYHLTGLTPATTYDCRVYYFKGPIWGSSAGTFTTGSAKDVNVDNTNSGVNIYPNPFVDEVKMDLFTQEETSVSWKIYDMTGKVVLTGNQSVSSGYSTLNIEAANLPKGVYMLNAIVNDQIQSFRIMKQ